MANSIKINLLYNIILNITNIIFPVVTAPYIARVLEPDGVGLYNFAYSTANYFALFACLGIPTYGIRIIGANSLDKELRDKTFCELFSILVYMTFALSIIYLFVVFSVHKFHENAMIFLISGFALYVIPLKIDWYFSGLQQFGYIAARSIIIKTISIFALFLLVHEKNDLVLYVGISAFSIVTNEVWNFIKLIKTGVKVRLVIHGCKRHMKSILILFSSFIATAIYTSFGTILLGFFSDYSEVGFYNNASHVCRIAIPVVTSLATVALPKIAGYIKNNKDEEINKLISKSISLTLFMAFPLSVILFLFSSEFVPLFFGSKFYDSIIPMKILSSLVLIVGLNNITGIQVLVGMGKDNEFLKSVTFSAIISVIVYLVLIPPFGSIGAAVGTAIAELLILMITVYYIKKSTSISLYIIKDILTTIISIIVLIIVFCCLKCILTGWGLVIFGSFIAGICYILAQLILKNTTTELALNIVKRKFHL